MGPSRLSQITTITNMSNKLKLVITETLTDEEPTKVTVSMQNPATYSTIELSVNEDRALALAEADCILNEVLKSLNKKS